MYQLEDQEVKPHEKEMVFMLDALVVSDGSYRFRHSWLWGLG